jgi:hypothetical protein
MRRTDGGLCESHTWFLIPSSARDLLNTYPDFAE